MTGTTRVLFEPLDFLARLAALVPKPRVDLPRFHGVFAPNSAHRARVTKARRGKGASGQAAAETDEPLGRAAGGDDLGIPKIRALARKNSSLSNVHYE